MSKRKPSTANEVKAKHKPVVEMTTDEFKLLLIGSGKQQIKGSIELKQGVEYFLPSKYNTPMKRYVVADLTCSQHHKWKLHLVGDFETGAPLVPKGWDTCPMHLGSNVPVDGQEMSDLSEFLD